MSDAAALQSFAVAFNALPSPFKILDPHRHDLARGATAFNKLPDVLIPSNRNLLVPPRVLYGYPMPYEEMNALIERILLPEGNPLCKVPDFIKALKEKVSKDAEFGTVYLDGQNLTMITLSTNNGQVSGLEEVADKLQKFIDVAGSPVWCLSSERFYWTRS